jgi:hypothetical protein
MTTLALAEQIGGFLADVADRVDTERHHDKVIHRVAIGKQVFAITCEESAPDKPEPAV